MKLGLTLPSAGEDTSPERIAQVAVEAERIGLASVWTFERLMNPVDGATPIGGGDAVPLPESYGCVYDPIETLAYLAARTSTVTLGTCGAGIDHVVWTMDTDPDDQLAALADLHRKAS